MLGYITIGALNGEASGKFYDAVLGECGLERKFSDGGWIGYGASGEDSHSVYICSPFNKEAATPGNGMMVAFKVDSKAAVDATHRAGLANGGADDGTPGYRPPEKQSWYGAYLRDPTGNKVAIYLAS